MGTVGRENRAQILPSPLRPGVHGSLARPVEQRFQLAAIVESSSDAIVSKDLTGTVLSWNGGAQQLFGYTAEEMIGRPIHTIYPQERLDEETQILARIGRREIVRSFETQRLAKSGRLIDVSVTVSPVLDENGRILGASTVMRDVTERKQVERALRESEERYRQLVNSLPAAVFTCDAAGRIQLYNSAAAALWGRAPKIGEDKWYSFYRIVDAEGNDLPPDEWPIAQALRGGCIPGGVEITVERPDGTRRHVHANPEPMLDSAGRIVGAINMLIDITDRKQAEAELAATKDDLALQVEALTRLHALAMQLTKTPDLTPALQAVLETLVEFHGADFGLISLHDEHSGCLTIEASVGCDDGALQKLNCVKPGPLAGACGSAFATKSRAVIEDVESDPRFKAFRAAARSIGFRAVHSTPIIARTGEPVGVMSIHFRAPRAPSARELQFTDMCARHAADAMEAARNQHALRESEQRFRQMADHAPLMVWVAAPSGECTFLSKSWYEFTGQTPESGLGRGWLDAIHPEDIAPARDSFAKAQGERTPFRLEYRLRRKDGEYRWMIDSAAPRFTARGEFVGYVGSVIDVTEEKRNEVALRESESRFRQIADQAPVLIWVNGLTGCEFVNREYIEFLGCTMNDVRGMAWREFVHPDDVNDYVGAYARAFAARAPFEGLFRFRRADGEYRWLRSSGVPRLNANGEFLGYVGCSVDITDIKNTEEALRAAKEAAEAANQAKDRFIAVLSHELRTPLTPVLMAAAAMESDPELPAMIREDISLIRRNVELETKLIDDLLDLSRIVTAKFRLQPQLVDLNSIVRDVCEICRPRVLEKGIRLYCELGQFDAFTNGDPARLHQVLWNILNNAAKFTPQGGEIYVTTMRTAEERLRVEVRDTGIGIAPDVLPHVFDAFEQGDSGITRQFGGLGLGLAISKAIVGFHGGVIRAQSDGIGKGSTVTVELAARAAAPSDAQAPPTAERQPLSSSLRLLVVEDHADTAKMLSRILGSFGHKVRTANSVAGALEVAAHEQFDVLVSDVGLPDATGYELMREVRARYGLRGIAMSGYGMDEDVRAARDAGFVEHLTKPVDVPQLEAAVRRVAGLAAIAR